MVCLMHFRLKFSFLYLFILLYLNYNLSFCTLRCHISGAYAFDDDTGFWLISSVPEFPAPRKQGYRYELKQIVKGQSILCVTVPRKNLPEMGNSWL